MNELELKAFLKQHLSAKIHIDAGGDLVLSLEIDGDEISYDYVEGYEIYKLVEGR